MGSQAAQHEDRFPLQKGADQNGPVTVCLKKCLHGHTLTDKITGGVSDRRNGLTALYPAMIYRPKAILTIRTKDFFWPLFRSKG